MTESSGLDSPIDWLCFYMYDHASNKNRITFDVYEILETEAIFADWYIGRNELCYLATVGEGVVGVLKKENA